MCAAQAATVDGDLGLSESFVRAMEGTVLIKRICGHSSPYTFKKNERYGKQRLEKFLSRKCPKCTEAAIADLEARQKAAAALQRKQKAEQQAKSEQGTKADAKSDRPAA